MKRLFLFLGLLVLSASGIAAEPPEFVVKPATKANLQEIRGGGYVLYLRHGLTDRSRPDRAPQVDLNDCSTQRPLSDEGRKLMARIGEYLRKAAIPIAEVRVSPLCRARESAQIVFGENKFVVDNQLMYSGNMTDQEKAPVVARTRALLTQPVPAGSNRLILAHAPNLMDAIGYFPKQEGTLVI
ncbi:MAG TPA: histidine phosphatase family protein, partial [Rhodocyclaceae bacterium]|nr:histidine phosphatase family protein [Rhodocyclaceae bacterium]